MSSIQPIQWAIKPTPSSSSAPSQKRPCTVFVGADPQQSHQASQVISCLIGKNLSAQDSNPSLATHFFLFITDSFLKTKDQVLPLVRRMVDPHFKQRLFPVIMEPTLSIYKPGEERPWVEYWEGILNNTSSQSSEYGEIRSIKENIGALIKAMRETNLPKLDTLLNDDLKLVTDAIENRSHLLQEKRFFFLPTTKAESTIGLEALLAQLSSLFETQSTVVLTGEKGIGKTTLAVEYAKGSTIYPTGIFWFNAEHLENAFETLAVQLGTSKEDAKRELLRIDRALLIFDNVTDRSQVPSFPTCHTLIIGQHLPQPDMTMTDLTEEDAVRLMELNDPQASLLVTILDKNPAKIAEAIGYIKSRKISIENYIHYYLNERDNLLAKQKGNKPASAPTPVRRNSLASAVDSSIDRYQDKTADELSQELKNENIQIFISYNWGSKSEVEQIDSAFKQMGIELLRDTREARPFASLPEFMKKVIRQADYTFNIVTDSYLKSFACIFEVINLLKDPYWRSRIFPIVLAAAPLDEQVYITHWEQEAARLKLVGTPEESAIAEEGAKKVGPFLQFVKGLQLESLTDQLSTNFQKTLAAMLARQEKLEKKGLYRQGIFHLPMGRNKNFTGREKEMTLLEESLKKDQHCAITNTGMGGVGKTQLALEYAYRHQEDYEMVYWVRSEDMSTVQTDYRLLGQEMGIDEKFLQEDRVITTVKGELEKRKNWLLIFDNAEDPNALTEAIPQSGSHVLITSRNPNWPHPVGISTFNNDEAIHLLKKMSGVTGQDQELALLAKELGYLPLALSQAGAYVRKQQIDVGTYLTDYKKLLSEQEKGYPGSVATAWLMSIEKIAKEDPNALLLLYICSHLAPDNIPDTLLNAWLKKKTKRDTGLDFQEALRVLESYSLISQKVVGNEHKKLISIHRLIQTVTQDKCPKEEVISAIELGIEVLYEQFEGDMRTQQGRELTGALIEHAVAISTHAEEQKLLGLSVRDLMNQVGIFFLNYGLLTIAKEIFENNLRITIAALGTENHAAVIDDLNNLGMVLREQGDLNGAKKMHEKALEITIPTLNNREKHLMIASCYVNIGKVLHDLGDLKEAKEMYEKALEMRISVHGTQNHTDVASCYANIGLVLHNLGHFKEAKVMQEKALEMRIAALGTENHIKVADIYLNLGNSLYGLGDLNGAKEMYEKALAIKVAAYGSEYHIRLADCYYNLGLVFHSLRDLKRAKEMYEKALAIKVAAFGSENHAHLADCYYNLGLVLHSLRDLKRAKEMYEKALAIKVATLGSENHAHLADCYHYLGLVLLDQHNFKEAKAMFEKALTIYITTLATENHSSVADSYSGLGSVLCRLNDLKEGKAMHEKALAIRLTVLGTENHEDVAESCTDLGAVFYLLNERKKAMEYFVKARNIYLQTGTEYNKNIDTQIAECRQTNPDDKSCCIS